MKVSWSRIRRIGRKHLAGILAGVAVVVLVQFGLLDAEELGPPAQLFELRAGREPMPQIVIVTIDESTSTEMNEQWPFARARHAELLMQLAAGKPRLIGIDLIFDAPSSRGPKDDDAFGKAIAFAGNVVLGAAYTKDIQPYTRRETFNFPIPVLRRGAAAVAPVNMHADAVRARRRHAGRRDPRQRARDAGARQPDPRGPTGRVDGLGGGGRLAGCRARHTPACLPRADRGGGAVGDPHVGCLRRLRPDGRVDARDGGHVGPRAWLRRHRRRALRARAARAEAISAVLLARRRARGRAPQGRGQPGHQPPP